MADEKSLRAIGFSFAAITAAVVLIAAVMVANEMRGAIDQERPQVASASAAV